MSSDWTSEPSHCRIVESVRRGSDWIGRDGVVDLQYLGEEIGVLDVVRAVVGDGNIEFIVVVSRCGSGEDDIVESHPVGLRTQESNVLNPHRYEVIHKICTHDSALGSLSGVNTQKVAGKLARENITNAVTTESCNFEVEKGDFQIVAGEVVGAGEVDVDGEVEGRDSGLRGEDVDLLQADEARALVAIHPVHLLANGAC